MSLPTLSELIADLQLAKDIAIRNENANSLVTATLAQAKLLGLDKGVTDDDAPTAKPVTIEFVAVDCKRYTDADIDRQADGSFFIKRQKAS
jgi:hypothetical protein